MIARRAPLRYRGGRRPTGYRGRRFGTTSTLRRQPIRTRALPVAARVRRPKPGFVRVVTPVRVPGRGGNPPRTVRVVSDIRVPRGARTAGRPQSIGGVRR